jgi:hypothetical protein
VRALSVDLGKQRFWAPLLQKRSGLWMLERGKQLPPAVAFRTHPRVRRKLSYAVCRHANSHLDSFASRQLPAEGIEPAWMHVLDCARNRHLSTATARQKAPPPDEGWRIFCAPGANPTYVSNEQQKKPKKIDPAPSPYTDSTTALSRAPALLMTASRLRAIRR